MAGDSPSPPFQGAAAVAVVIPTEFAGLSEADAHSLRNIPAIFAESRAALERELGAPLALGETDPGQGPRWLIGPARCNPALARLRPPVTGDPELFLDRAGQLLISDAPTPDGVWETFSLLRSLARHAGGVLPVADCASIDDAIHRIQAEVGDSYPAFALRNLDWDRICGAHMRRVRAAADPVRAMQAWLAALQDAHTWVRRAVMPGDLPYAIWVTPEAMRLAHVPPGSAAWEAGARPGDRLVGEDPAGWWSYTAATPHSRPLVAGRRFLQDALTGVRTFTARSPQGRWTTWTETPTPTPWTPVARWERLPSGSGYLKIRAWVKAAELAAQIDAALADLRDAPGLIVDLRGNPGGDLALAQRFRDRFLPEAGRLGTIRYSTGHARLSDPEPILGTPAPPGRRWPKPVRFLTDPLTYSASEDAVLGLQGLPHVEVVGEPSGGGSGRVRILRLLPGWRLMISTALTYDRQGRCVEGAGIPVDRPVTPDRFTHAAEDGVLRAADRGW